MLKTFPDKHLFLLRQLALLDLAPSQPLNGGNVDDTAVQDHRVHCRGGSVFLAPHQVVAFGRRGKVGPGRQHGVQVARDPCYSQA